MRGGRPLLGVDCDNVLAAAEPAIVELLLGAGGTEPTGGTSFDLAPGMDAGRVAAALAAFHDEESLMGLPAVRGAAETLGALSERYEIHVITARPASARAATAGWLEARGIPYEALHVGVGSVGEGERRIRRPVEKYELGLPLRAMIEDHLPTALGFARRGVRSVLFDHPWNRDLGGEEPPARLVRVGSWSEVEAALGGAARRAEIPDPAGGRNAENGRRHA